MNPRYFFLDASREREVTSVGEPRRCEYARAAVWLILAFACLAVPIPALAKDAAVHQKLVAPHLLASPESAPLTLTAPAIHEAPDTSVDDDDDDDDAAIRIHSEWIASPPRLLFIDLHTPFASPVIHTSDCFLRGPPAATAFTS